MKTALRLSLAAIMLAGVNVSAATVYVSLESPNPTPPFATWDTAANVIQDAVDLAVDGDTVLVGDGVYSVGNREISVLDEFSQPPQMVRSGPARVVVTRPIRLESVNGPALTTIEGEQFLAEWGVATNGIRCVVLGTNATLSGFTLTHGGTTQASEGGGVWCASTNAVLTNCTVTSTVKGESGTSVRIERSRNLLDWEHVATVPIPATGQTLTDPVATVEPLLFYRAVVVP